MAALKKSRSVMEDGLTKAYGNLSVVIAEEDYDAVMLEREHLKSKYLKFRDTHIEYHETLEDEADIQVSDAYFYDVQQVYATQQNIAKVALKDMRLHVPIAQELSNEQSFKSLGHLINLPPLQLQKFSGKPDEFDNFITTFHEVIGKVVPDPAAKLVRLKSQLTGPALDSVKMCRTDSGDEGYARAIKILRERFGSPYIVCNSIIESLKYGPDVRSPPDIRTFSDELCSAEVTLKNNNMYTEIDTQNNIIEMCLRLESQLRYEWRSLVMKSKRCTGTYLKFSDFVTFVQEQADIVNDPLYGKDALKDRPNRSSKGKSITSLPVATHGVDIPIPRSSSGTTFSSQSPRGMQCLLCLKNHNLYSCYKFKNMSIDQRCDYVKANKLCILCLSKDHAVSNCRSSYICRVDSCGEKHSSALHVHASQSTTQANCGHSCDKSSVHMPTVPVVIDDIFHTFALLDSGSSTTFCTRRLMDELKLQGSKTTYQLQTLHGLNNGCTEAVNLHMSSTDGSKCLDLNNVLVVDEIPVAENDLSDVSKYPHLKDLSISEATQVDILIGQDNSAALLPVDIRRGHVNDPFATLTMMGWSLNGGTHVSVPSHRGTSYATSTTILDEEVYQPCEDEETSIPQETVGIFKEDQQSIVLDVEFLHHSLWKKPVSAVIENVLITVNVMLIMLCLMSIFITCVISLCVLSVIGYFIVYSSYFEASCASSGGVLFPVKHLSYIVTYCVYLYIMRHLLTTMFSDYEEYTHYIC